MYLPSPVLTLLLPLTALPHAYAQNITDPVARAELSLFVLQNWYNFSTGMWTGWWNSANAMTIIANLAKVDSNPGIQILAASIFANTAAVGSTQNADPGAEEPSTRKRATSGYDKGIDANGMPWIKYPEGWSTAEYGNVSISKTKQNASASAPVYDAHAWLDGFYDDDLWWALAFIAAYDVTKQTGYLNLGEGIFNNVARGWPSNCSNGGIYWNSKNDYVNAIANELFFSTAAHLANRVSNSSKYADWAVKSIDWFVASGMINNNSLINDGLTPDCKNNGLQTWSYNQGVILGGLAELSKVRPSDTYKDLATRLANASLATIFDKNGILQDPCGPLCGGDASQFKGIYMRGLQALYEVAPDPTYVTAINANADSVWNNDRNALNQLSIQWAGPFVEVANSTTHSSAMEALVAAIAVKSLNKRGTGKGRE